MAGPRTQRKAKEIVKTFKDHGPHRRNNKSECQECTCNRRMCIKFKSRKICVTGNQCDNSDFDFHNAEDKKFPVLKISLGFFWNYCDSGNRSSHSFNFV